LVWYARDWRLTIAAFTGCCAQAFEVESSSRAKQLSEAIGDRLGLKNVAGFALFVKIADKVISVPDSDFFFDFVRHLTEWLKKTKSGATNDAAPANHTYQVFFMKKIWSETVVGEDENADSIFHYHQELPKLLRGYHACSVEDAVNLAALVYRVKFGDDKTQFGQITTMLGDLVPIDLVGTKGAEEWKKGIVGAFNKNAGKGALDAKVLFLKIVQRWPTFGSAFFEVVQKTEPKFPQNVTVAINKNGVSFIDPEGKGVLVSVTSHHAFIATCPLCMFNATAAYSPLQLRPTCAFFLASQEPPDTSDSADLGFSYLRLLLPAGHLRVHQDLKLVVGRLVLQHGDRQPSSGQQDPVRDQPRLQDGRPAHVVHLADACNDEQKEVGSDVIIQHRHCLGLACSRVQCHTSLFYSKHAHHYHAAQNSTEKSMAQYPL
jgi:hypothetical protein